MTATSQGATNRRKGHETERMVAGRVLRDAANRLRWIANSGYIEDPGIKRIIRSWADELDATLVPPWPGAVLSGLWGKAQPVAPDGTVEVRKDGD